jgi:hypothetical protein
VEKSRKRLSRELQRLLMHLPESQEEVGSEDGTLGEEAFKVNAGESVLGEEESEESEEEWVEGVEKPDRLVTLLQHAYAYQIQNATQKVEKKLSTLPSITSLLQDFSLPSLPDPKPAQVLSGHEQSVKCLSFLPNTSQQIQSTFESFD